MAVGFLEMVRYKLSELGPRELRFEPFAECIGSPARGDWLKRKFVSDKAVLNITNIYSSRHHTNCRTAAL